VSSEAFIPGSLTYWRAERSCCSSLASSPRATATTPGLSHSAPSSSQPSPSSARTARTRQLGHNSRRDPRLYQQQHQFDSTVSNNWNSFLRLSGLVSKWTYQVGNSLNGERAKISWFTKRGESKSKI
jgi:hypothetical protein